MPTWNVAYGRAGALRAHAPARAYRFERAKEQGTQGSASPKGGLIAAKFHEPGRRSAGVFDHRIMRTAATDREYQQEREKSRERQQTHSIISSSSSPRSLASSLGALRCCT